jgi:hypothetical protein
MPEGGELIRSMACADIDLPGEVVSVLWRNPHVRI